MKPKSKFLIVVTKECIASKNIGDRLLEDESDWEKIDDKTFKHKQADAILYWHDKDLLFCDDLDELFDCNLYILAFRHKSEKGTKSLTVHSPGNPMDEAWGSGNPHELGYSYPKYNWMMLNNLAKANLDGFEVSYEATHHGPTTLKKPVMFVEIGSSEQEWNNMQAVDAVSTAIRETIRDNDEDCTPCIGLGGTHYPERFTRRSLNSKMAFGHVIANYVFEKVNESVIRQAVEKTVTEGAAVSAVIDTKSAGKAEDRNRILEILQKMNLAIMKLK